MDIVIGIAFIVLFILIVIVTSCWCSSCHRVYDDGSGKFRIECPEEYGVRSVYGSIPVCPGCGAHLKAPRKKYRWEKQ